MTELYLDKKKVVLPDNTNLKITRENPMVTKSGNFSLDVRLSMHVKENAEVLGRINRIDVHRRYTTFQAVLLADGMVVLDGVAVVTEASQDEVKVQLLSGNSEVRFWDRAEKKYIDNIDFTEPSLFSWLASQMHGQAQGGRGVFVPTAEWNTIGVKGVAVYMPVYDETNDSYINRHITDGGHTVFTKTSAPQPNFMFVLRRVVESMGYSLVAKGLDLTLLDNMYIASARCSPDIADALPHWTVKEYVENVQDFLNCTFVFDDTKKTAAIVANSYVGISVDITDDVVDEFTAEIVSDDDVDKNIVSSNIAYAERGGEPDIDMVSQEIMQSFEHLEYSSRFSVAVDAARGRNLSKIYVTPEGKYVYTGDRLERVDHFGMLVKDEDNLQDKYELKIVPCRTILRRFIVHEENEDVFGFAAWTTMLSMTNQYVDPEEIGAWQAINENSVNGGTEKEDVMQVFLVDGVEMMSPITEHIIYKDDIKNIAVVEMDDGHRGKMTYYPMPFTDPLLNIPEGASRTHEDWSLALTNCRCAKYHGKMFLDGVRQDNNVELSVSFRIKGVPDVSNIYYIRGKKYRCKKIELSLSARGMEPVAKGYFLELL